MNPVHERTELSLKDESLTILKSKSSCSGNQFRGIPSLWCFKIVTLRLVGTLTVNTKSSTSRKFLHDNAKRKVLSPNSSWKTLRGRPTMIFCAIGQAIWQISFFISNCVAIITNAWTNSGFVSSNCDTISSRFLKRQYDNLPLLRTLVTEPKDIATRSLFFQLDSK